MRTMENRTRFLYDNLILAVIASVVVYMVMQRPGIAQEQPAGSNDATKGNVDYLKQVKPLLRERCFVCHGGLKQQAGLRLDTLESMLRGGDTGPVVVKGDSEKSLLLARVSAAHVAQRMPPEHEGEPLSAEQITVLRDWIAAGALAPPEEQPEADPRDHWAFRPISRPPVPEVIRADWARNSIDGFVARQHERFGLTPQAEASRLILLRRLSLDLIGLPPAAEEIAAIEGDDAPDWYQRAVARLLDDPRHGERWARHWMDVWRYSDWWGFGNELRNSQKHIWHWRDWIVASLNSDTPYDEMVRLMLAADELHPNDLDKLRATGYLARNYFLFNRNQWMDETVEHVAKGFLGLTMNCAKCHDHKYDPFPQVDYYRLRAFFEPYHVRVDVAPGEADLVRDGIPRAFDGLPDAPTFRFIRGNENAPDKSSPIEPGIPAVLEFEPLTIKPVDLPLESWQPERRAWVAAAYRAAAQKKIETAEAKLGPAREKLAAAQKNEAALPAKPKTESPAPRDGAAEPTEGAHAVAEAQLELHVAELALAAARAELHSVDLRAAAIQCNGKRTNEGDAEEGTKRADAEREAARAAARAERELASLQARLALAEAELQLHRAAADKRDAVAKEVATARETLEKSLKQVEEQIEKPSEQYTKLTGAQWTPTRFFNSGKDDPTVTFQPRSTGRRKALAAWITDRRNPLTARVAVNHLWTRHFGTPLVPTVFDFGRKGTPSANPDLLDWLAAELIESGWSMKHLHRLIVESATYRLSSSSAGAEANVAKDPDNTHLWRRTASRLESQAVRDSILALTGTLDATCGGPPVPSANQADSTRRSLYFVHSNNERNLFLTLFDEALVKECYRREQSIVPQQALALTNSRLVLDASRPIAHRLTRQLAAQGLAADDDAVFVRLAFAVLLGGEPIEAEVAACARSLDAWKKLPEAEQGDATSGFARANLIWVLLNHNDFVTVQ